MIKSLSSIPGTSASRKQLYIGLIVVALVVVLVLVYFGTKQFAGKATALVPAPGTTLMVGQAGITGTTTGIGTLTVDIGVNIGTAQSVAFDFVLNYPADALEYVSVTPVVPWGANRDSFERITPGRGNVAYELATIDYTQAITNTAQLARVTFNVRRALTSADYQALTFSSFHVYNLADETNLISTTVGGSGGTEIQQCTEAQCRTDNPNLILRSECTASTQEECLSAYSTNLILRSDCQSGDTVDIASCTTYFNANLAEKDTLCGAWLDTLNANSLTSTQRTTLCGAGAVQGFNADLNGDGNVNDGDIIIIQLAMLAKESRYNTCGASSEASCSFPGVFVCENLQNSYTQAIASCGG